MERRPHDLPCIPVPDSREKQLMRLYLEPQVRESYAVDIDAIHYKRGAVKPHLRRARGG